jgi:hypothetical protein
MSDLITVIQEYQREVDDGLALFEQQVGRRDLIAAWREGILEKSGVLKDGTEYEFHGVGCCLFFNDHEIDFDFSVGERSDGFDSWKLWRYAKQFPDRFPRYQSKSEVEKDFGGLVAAGMIVQLFPAQSALYFFVEQ